jgi:alkylation response protein AidB-like acyl-CoA dehydrogenase
MTGFAGPARDLAPLVAERAAEGERDRRLALDVVEALRVAGLFRMLVPAAIGGGEAEPDDALAAIEAVAAADGSAGWVAAVCSTAGLIAARLPEEAAREIAGSPDSISCGVFAPKGRAGVAGGTLELSGRWPLASGVDHADWVGLGCLVDDDGGPPGFRYAILPRSEVEVIDTWNALGLRATSSHDVAVEGARVPRERSTALFTDEPTFEGALYRFPVFGVLALAIAAVCTGIARSALEAVVELATEKTPAGGRRKLAERGTAQARVAESEAALRAARALVAEAVGEAWARARADGEVDVERRMALRLAATHAARTAAATVTAAHELAGVSAVYEGVPLERAMRDITVAARHMLVAPATNELAGRLLLGVETDTTQL